VTKKQSISRNSDGKRGVGSNSKRGQSSSDKKSEISNASNKYRLREAKGRQTRPSQQME
jgi:hypothetical protein